MDMDGQMAERPMASDCKSDGLSPTGVQIPPCPFGKDEGRRMKDEQGEVLFILPPSAFILSLAGVA